MPASGEIAIHDQRRISLVGTSTADAAAKSRGIEGRIDVAAGSNGLEPTLWGQLNRAGQRPSLPVAARGKANLVGTRREHAEKGANNPTQA